MVPAVFEVDPETNEANGLVHFYCSVDCLIADSNILSDIFDRGFQSVVSQSDNYGVVCEACGRKFYD